MLSFKRTSSLLNTLTGVLSLTIAGNAAAQANYPEKPIRFIVPYPPAGATDITARIVGRTISQNVGQQVLIDNRGGAAGNIGTDIAAKAAPDGYTVLYTLSSHTINPVLFAKLPFDVDKDFAPVTLVATIPQILVSHPSLPVNNIKDLIALAKNKPGALAYATAGTGSPGHLAGELFKLRTHTDLIHVPYKGGGPAVADLLGGQVPLLFVSIPAVLQYTKIGRLKAFGVSTLKRSGSAPEIPTIAEAGIPGFDVPSWLGALVPAKTPPAVVTRLHQEFVKALQAPEVKEAFFAQGADAVGNTPAEFDALIKMELKKWAKLIKDSGMKPD
ncbi:MAG: putative Bug-like extracytoplasmic solute binding receptor,TTT family [Betaproteobacteria bacterium]|nr:putative Bug-like extracytoplasmic solute binding receptor,TTT family [Betaproteobacteria bacterium]